MVSPWMENGNVLNFTRKNPEANRLQLVSLAERWTNVISDGCCLVVDRRGEWSKVSSPGNTSAREHSRGASDHYDSQR